MYQRRHPPKYTKISSNYKSSKKLIDINYNKFYKTERKVKTSMQKEYYWGRIVNDPQGEN